MRSRIVCTLSAIVNDVREGAAHVACERMVLLMVMHMRTHIAAKQVV